MIKLQINPIDFRPEVLFNKHKDELPKMEDMVDRVVPYPSYGIRIKSFNGCNKLLVTCEKYLRSIYDQRIHSYSLG